MPALDTPAIVEIGGYAPTRGAGSINWSRAFYEIAAQAQPLQKSNADGGLIRVVELAHFDGLFVETIEQTGVDAHFAEIFPEGLPVRAAAANGAMMNTDHAIAPDVGGGLA